MGVFRMYKVTVVEFVYNNVMLGPGPSRRGIISEGFWTERWSVLDHDPYGSLSLLGQRSPIFRQKIATAAIGSDRLSPSARNVGLDLISLGMIDTSAPHFASFLYITAFSLMSAFPLSPTKEKVL